MSRCLDQCPGGWSDGAAAYHEWFAPLSARFAVNACGCWRCGRASDCSTWRPAPSNPITDFASWNEAFGRFAAAPGHRPGV